MRETDDGDERRARAGSDGKKKEISFSPEFPVIGNSGLKEIAMDRENIHTASKNK